MNVLSVICIIGISQVIFLLIVLGFKKSKLRKNISTIIIWSFVVVLNHVTI